MIVAFNRRQAPEAAVLQQQLEEFPDTHSSRSKLPTPAGRAMAALRAVFAGFEREILRERVRAGLAQARLNGERVGRPETAARHAAQIRETALTPASADPKSPVGFRWAAPRCAAS
jgi:DNA invertase Pin-like site-specific DNA recombinase